MGGLPFVWQLAGLPLQPAAGGGPQLTDGVGYQTHLNTKPLRLIVFVLWLTF